MREARRTAQKRQPWGAASPGASFPAGAGWGARSAGLEQRGWKMGRHQRKDEKWPWHGDSFSPGS